MRRKDSAKEPISAASAALNARHAPPALAFLRSSSDGPACADDSLQQGKDLFRVLARVEPLLDNHAPTKPERLRLDKITQQGVNRLRKRVPVIDRQQPA